MGVQVSADPSREQLPRQPNPPRLARFNGQHWWATLAVTAAVVIIQWLRIRDTFFAIDDFILLGITRSRGLSLTLLRKPIFEHFSPVLWTENKLEVGPFHLNHSVALVFGLAVTAVGVACLHRLVLRLTRSPTWAVALSALYGSSLIVTSILRWWTTSVHDNLAATLSVACLLAFCRFEEERRPRDAWLSVALLAAALLTHEKALLVPLYLGLLWLLVYQRTLAPGRLWSALQRELWLWISYGVVWMASLANFFTNYYQPVPLPAFQDLGAFALRSVFTTFLPVSYGIRLPEVGGSVGGAVETLGVVGLLLGIVVTLRVAPRAGRGWLFLGIAFAANLWVLGTARLPVFHTGVYRSLQWQLELALLFPIGLAMVIRETRFGRKRDQQSSGKPTWIAVALLGIAAIPYMWLSVRSNRVVHSEFNGGDYSRPFLAALDKGIENARVRGQAPTLLDRPLPGTFAPDWMFPYNMLREFLPTFHLGARVGGHTPGEQVLLVADDGSVHPYELASVVGSSLVVRTSGQPVSQGSTCAALDPQGVVFRANLPATGGLGAAPVLRLDYRADAPANVDVMTTDPDGRSEELSYGQLSMNAADTEYDLLLRSPQYSDHLDVVITGQAGAFCLNGATLGAATPISG